MVKSLYLKLTVTAGIIAVSLTGCNSVDSQVTTGSDILTGVAYTVPTQYVTITAKRSKIDIPEVSEAKTAFVKAAAALITAQDAADKAKQAWQIAKAEIKLVPTGNADLLKKIIKAAADKQFEYAKLQQAASTARQKRDRAELAFSAAQSDNSSKLAWNETIEISASKPIPDPNYRFSLSPRFSSLRTDHGTIEVSDGLLQSSNVTASGELGNILVSLAKSIVYSSMGFPISDSADIKNTETSEDQEADSPPIALPVSGCSVDNAMSMAIPNGYDLKSGELIQQFDPSDVAKLNEINLALCKSGYSLRVTIDNSDGLQAPTYDMSSLNQHGIFYRVPRPVTFTVKAIPDGMASSYVVDKKVVNLLSGAPLNVLEFGSSALVEVTNNATFKDGTLTKYEYKKDGELDELVSIPFKVVGGATQAVSEVVQLKFNIASGQNQLNEQLAQQETNEEVDAINAQKELLEAQKNLYEAQLNTLKALQELEKAQEGAADNE